jgi:hypothetical protein
MSDSGWNNEDLFLEWLKHFPTAKVLRLLDNHEATEVMKLSDSEKKTQS